MKLVYCFVFLFILSLNSLFAEEASYEVDLDGDASLETIVVYQKFEAIETVHPWPKEGVISVFRPDGRFADSFSVAGNLGKVEFIDLNKDNDKQIVARSHRETGDANIAIYGYKDDKLYEIFRKSSECGIYTDFFVKPAEIRIDFPKDESKGCSSGLGETISQIFLWNSRKFVFDSALSSASKLH